MVYQQSLLNHLMARAYHWYDMRIPGRIPGWKTLERFLVMHMGAEHMVGFEGEPDVPRWRDRLVSWTIMQDFRCFDLSERRHIRGRVMAEVTAEQYEKIHSKQS